MRFNDVTTCLPRRTLSHLRPYPPPWSLLPRRFLPNLGFGAVIIAYTEWSKKQVRRDPEGWWARNVQW